MATTDTKPDDKAAATAATSSSAPPDVAPVTYDDGVPRLADGSVELLPTNPPEDTSGVFYAQSTVDPESVPKTMKALEDGDYVVRYKGLLTILDDGRRIITRADWEARGITGQDDVAFVKGNGFAVPTSDLNAKALAYCRDIDPGLVIEPA